MLTPEQRQRTEDRITRYREEHPEEAARIDALFVPVHQEIERLRDEIELFNREVERPYLSTDDAVQKPS